MPRRWLSTMRSSGLPISLSAPSGRAACAQIESPSSLPGLTHGCPARIVLDGVHDVDSTRFQEFANQLDTRKDQRRAASEYRFPWAPEAYSVGVARSTCG